ncbi:type I secretion C-terminal target domain (VC_A0849 subclass) [Pseudomonas segetis]|uniref:Type I secretion C-terminal target domain (VC_A0849 subclass) n=1 Tax=Pseudomonas segetis TaxID=298908 RepID=A0A238Z6F2_9PSED|nr:type I secretion C-terminal target domain (VC_A0849 subclass) [Pseudomonas segetis]
MTASKKRPSFAEVKAAALRSIDRVLAHWLPGGKRVDNNREYTAPNPLRADKHAGSFKVNLAKGTWSDFATGDKGGDLIDLVRYLDGGTDIEACNKLADFLNVTASSEPAPVAKQAKTPEWVPVQPVPDEAMGKCPLKHRQHGKPSKVWVYKDAESRPLFVLYRFDLGPDENGTPPDISERCTGSYAAINCSMLSSALISRTARSLSHRVPVALNIGRQMSPIERPQPNAFSVAFT